MQTGAEVLPIFCSEYTGGCLPEVKWPEREGVHLPPVSAEVEADRSFSFKDVFNRDYQFASTLPYVII
jgi:hypothetical protein